MRVVLEIIAGPHSGQKLVLRPGETVSFGRTERADHALPLDDYVSGVHFSIECRQADCLVRDLGSRNGTTIDGVKLAEATVEDGSRIQAGRTVFAVHIDQATNWSRTAVLPTLPLSAAPASPGVPPGPPPSPPVAAPKPSPAPQSPRPHRQAPADPTVPVQPHGPNAPLMPARGVLRVTLQVVAGHGEHQKIVLRPGETVNVGRTEWADLVFSQDDHMSGLHFSLECRPEGCRIQDLGSRNGTLVNGVRVTEAMLVGGEEISAGKTRFVIGVEGEVRRSASPEPTDAGRIKLGPVATGPTSAGPLTARTVTVGAAARGAPAAFRSAVSDPDPGVRRAALWAAAWTRQPWLLEHCRRAAGQFRAEAWEAVELLAVLGQAEDLAAILGVGRSAEWGPQRLRILGAFGHPAAVDLLLAAMGQDDADSATVAAEAFAKITGTEVPRDRAVGNAADGEAEPGEVVLLPSAEAARARWKAMAARFPQSTRLCRGFDVSREASGEVLEQLDMESRWEATLRERFAGRWRGRWADLERVPRPAGVAPAAGPPRDGTRDS